MKTAPCRREEKDVIKVHLPDKGLFFDMRRNFTVAAYICLFWCEPEVNMDFLGGSHLKKP